VTIRWLALFSGIPPLLRAELPDALRAFEWNANAWQAKAWYGNKALHYEVWVRHSAKVVELGLHFEADPLTNARLLGAFRARAKQLRRDLGSDARIEEWDKGWTRIWQPFALERLEPAYVEKIQTRFVDYVRVLEPILREELPNDVSWRIAPPRRAAKVTSSRTSRSGR
jgi:hypothetical protein